MLSASTAVFVGAAESFLSLKGFALLAAFIAERLVSDDVRLPGSRFRCTTSTSSRHSRTAFNLNVGRLPPLRAQGWPIT
jgi:hypothetical protein